MNNETHVTSYILKAKKVAEPPFQSTKIAGNFRAILGHSWAILGHIWATLGHFESFLGHFVAFLDKFEESSNFFAAPLGSGNSLLECMLANH